MKNDRADSCANAACRVDGGAYMWSTRFHARYALHEYTQFGWQAWQ